MQGHPVLAAVAVDEVRAVRRGPEVALAVPQLRPPCSSRPLGCRTWLVDHCPSIPVVGRAGMRVGGVPKVDDGRSG